ncbi:cellulose synthase/poly-beta-1,6-N-acetylglucosamine synthase-like glycosyltransferase [Balneicella halophila]|uniref:Cellulose synthase/poly-beta-1,6-N-acetylglucosamine synthase-like glycosyltransferase n=2 Tax=Balneicella halophila TaxID=1537566 RepID=A0A7L4UNS6_BALHA|nr:cellulose synthase/poly-beta-1,6-N-acetylglucosamine synthase-like glycosyltransferase [Balneicella halophila]
MIYLAYISLLFLGMQLLNVVLNLVFKQRIKISETENNERISLLIPARNEETNISFLLSDLQKSKNENIEIIVFDDESTDNTAEVVQNFANQDKRIVLLKSDGLPQGWLGKNHACYQLAQKAQGKYLLFLDADVRIEANVINDAVSYLKRFNLKLLSIFPIQIQKTFGEKISIPVMNYILLTLLPLVFVRISPFKSHAAANGQFMLFDSETYRKIQPHHLFKKSAVEDIKIARHYKKEKLKIACLTGERRIQCRMYKTYKEAVKGFSKNVFIFFGNIPLLAFLFWAFSAFGFIPVWLALPQYLTYYFAVLVSVLLLYSLVGRQNSVINFLFFPFHLLFLITILGKAIKVKKHKKLEWKERNIYS